MNQSINESNHQKVKRNMVWEIKLNSQYIIEKNIGEIKKCKFK